MHIPDGYLSPQTCGVTYAVMVPIWAVAARKVRNALGVKQISTLALGAAFSFVAMMFNIPVPGGTTAHIAGGVLIAVLLGPWAACIALTTVLAIQALIFQDGGITTLGANCFNMAFAGPMVGWLIYRLFAGNSIRRRSLAAGAGAYVGICVSAILTALVCGIQPTLAKDAAGLPAYSPFPLKTWLIAMGVSHLFLIGPIEGIVTGLVVSRLLKTETAGLAPAQPVKLRPVLIGLAALVLATPLGLLLPSWFGAGDAFGEWGGEELKRMVGFVPKGLDWLSNVWRAPVPDYALPNQTKWLSLSYIAVGILGAAVVALITLAIARALARRKG